MILNYTEESFWMKMATSYKVTCRCTSCMVSDTWIMEFNIGKCKSLHYGYGSARREYTIDEEFLQSTDEEKDLWVLMSSSLKPSLQCAAAASKAMSALYRSRRTFKYINEESFKILYKTYIRPNLEFCIPAWCP